MEEDLQTLLGYLSWFQTKEKQEIAIQNLIKHKEKFIDSLLTKSAKDQWHNAVRVIGKLEYSDQVRMIAQMLFLLKDVNWPGAVEAIKIMESITPAELKPHIIRALVEANEENDTVWIAWIKVFIEKIKILEQFEDYNDILNKAEW